MYQGEYCSMLHLVVLLSSLSTLETTVQCQKQAEAASPISEQSSVVKQR